MRTVPGKPRRTSGARRRPRVVRLEGQHPSRTARLLLDGIRTGGVVVVRGGLSRRRFFALARRLGYVFDESFVYVDETTPRFVRMPHPVPFHTDHAKANIVAWLCEMSEDSRFCYMDARRIYAGMTPDDQEALARVTSYVPAPHGPGFTRPALTVPVVERAARPPRFHWESYWGTKPLRADSPAGLLPTTPAEQRAVKRFWAHIDIEPERADITLALAAGDAVFVDNNRFLHGRGALPRTSPRQLYRLWINTDGWPSARRHHLAAPTVDVGRF